MKERRGEKTVVVVVVEIEIVLQNYTGASWRMVAFFGCGSLSAWRAEFMPPGVRARHAWRFDKKVARFSWL